MRSTSNYRWFAAAGLMITLVGCGSQQDRIDRTQAQIHRVTEDLDKRTTETGVYIRIDDKNLGETDAWGTPLKVVYAQGGVAETLVVRSAGPDREFHTADDITAQGMSANLKGIGTAVKKNTEDTASNLAKGLVKGSVKGIKESVKETFSRKKRPEEALGQDKPNPPR